MRKFLGFIFIFLAAIIALVFFVLLNLSLFANENKVKALLEESKFYDTAAFYIKDQIIKESGLTLNEGTVFEDLNNKITTDRAKTIVDGAVANAFKALKDPTGENLIFPVSFSDEGSGLSFEKFVNLNDNSILDMLANRSSYLLIIGVITFLLIIAGILVCSSKAADRFLFFGLWGILLFILLLGVIVSLRGMPSLYIDYFIDQSNFFIEPKLVSTFKRSLLTLIDKQSLLYIAEAIAIFVLFLVTFWGRKMVSKENLREIESKI